MNSVAENIKKYKELIPHDVELVAVSKFHPVSLIREAYDAGQLNFGESRVQEFIEKEKQLPKDIRWHFIGHLQTNKVKPIIGKVSLIESVDSERLLRVINSESEKMNLATCVLLQVHVAAEDTKFGFYPEELFELLDKAEIFQLNNVEISGLMGMATNTDDEERIRKDFKTLHSIFLEIKEKYGDRLPHFHKLSMGMSGDWKIAVEEGSNIVRIGSAIFGEREY